MFGDALELAGIIDHTELKAAATPGDMDRLCDEALLYSFHSVCVNPCYVRLAAERLSGSGIKVCAVIDFPLGASTGAMKAMEAVEAAGNGADELDIVMPIGLFRSGQREAAGRQISEVVLLTPGLVHKVIIEACYLTDEEKTAASEMAANAGAEFVKTSTGCGPGGATAEDVRLVKRAVAGRCRVKAAGGIRDIQALYRMVEAGADRIGTSSGVAMVEEFKRRGQGPGGGST